MASLLHQRGGAWDGIAANLPLIAQDKAEFSATRINFFSVDSQGDRQSVKTQVGAFDARSQVSVGPEDRIPHIGKVSRLGAIQENGVLRFGVVTDDAVITGDRVSTDVGAVTNHAIFPDDTGSSDVGTRFDDRTFPN